MTSLVRLTLAWTAGIVLAAQLPAAALAWRPLVAAVALGLLAAGILATRRVGRRTHPTAGARPRPAFVSTIVPIAIAALLGAARYAMTRPDLGAGHVAVCNGLGVATVVGRIVDEPDRRDRGIDYRVGVTGIRSGCGTGSSGADPPDTHDARDPDGLRPAHGLVLVRGPRFPRHPYGARVAVTGEIEEPPVLEGFDYRAYLARKDVHSVVARPRIDVLGEGGGNPVRRALIAVRKRGRHSLALALPEPEAALATGILLGDDRGIPARVANAFRATNTTHVIAISGSNIALLVTLLAATFGRVFGRRRSVPLVLATVGLYSLLVGADAAVVRAAIMGGLSVVALHVGRPNHAATALMAAVLAMTAWRPDVWWDLGFQLSLAATAGLIVFAGRFGAGLQGWLAARMPAGRARAAAGLVNDAVMVTLAAQLTTWPIIAHQMGQVSLAGLAANFLIVPVQPAVMILGGLAAGAGMLWPAAGQLVGIAAWLPLAYTIRVVEAFARLPHAATALHVSTPFVAAYYALLGLFVARGAVATPARAALAHLARIGPALRRARTALAPPAPGLPALLLSTLLLPALALVCAVVWLAVRYQPDGLLHVVQLDVGQGDAILVVTPNGRRMLVDGGPSPSAVLDGLGRHFAPWDRRLDVVVLTHPDMDHVAGLPAVLDRYDVAWIVDPELPAESPDAALWSATRSRVAQQAADDTPARIVRAAPGARIVLDVQAGVEAAVLWPPDPRLTGTDTDVNNNAVVLRLTYGRTAVLLTGDIEAPAEAAILAAGAPLAADVLKVAHHGSASSTTPDFLAAVRPRLALIGVGADNRYGHPDAGVLARLGTATVRRTDRDGAIDAMTDGVGWWVR